MKATYLLFFLTMTALAGCGGGAPEPDPDAGDDVVCCPIEAPSCDCFGVGGTMSNGTCEAVCDAAPDGWTTQADENGCPILVGGSGNCFGPDPDAGGDAPDVDADPLCCPIASEPSCDCFDIGGSAANGCQGVCDAAPGGWVLGTDDAGCPQWQGGGSDSCLQPPDPCDGIVPPGCFAADASTLVDVDGEQFFVRLPPAPDRGADVVLFVPGGAGTRDTASITYDRWLAGGAGLDSVVVAVPYAADGNLGDESERVLAVLDRVQACTCHSGRAHLGGTSAGGLAAFSLMLTDSDRFETLLGAPGAFRAADPELLETALAGKRVFLGVGSEDAAWMGNVRDDYAALTMLGIDVVLVEFPGEGHILSEAFDPTPFFEFWSGP